MSKKTNTQWLHDRLTSGLLDVVGDKTESLGDLQETEWSYDFERLMRNRLLMGRYRYGKIAHNTEEPGNFFMVNSAISRLEAYKRTGNLEFLVDAANLCLVEFESGAHPTVHFEAADDGQHVGE